MHGGDTASAAPEVRFTGRISLSSSPTANLPKPKRLWADGTEAA